MKLRCSFETVQLDDTYTAVPIEEGDTQFRAVLQLNDVGAAMLRYIGESESPEEVHAKLCRDYPEDDPNEIGQKLCDFLNRLVREGILIP